MPTSRTFYHFLTHRVIAFLCTFLIDHPSLIEWQASYFQPIVFAMHNFVNKIGSLLFHPFDAHDSLLFSVTFFISRPSSQSLSQHGLPLGKKQRNLQPFLEINFIKAANVPPTIAMSAIIHAGSMGFFFTLYSLFLFELLVTGAFGS